MFAIPFLGALCFDFCLFGASFLLCLALLLEMSLHSLFMAKLSSCWTGWVSAEVSRSTTSIAGQFHVFVGNT